MFCLQVVSNIKSENETERDRERERRETETQRMNKPKEHLISFLKFSDISFFRF